MHYVYVLESTRKPWLYIGSTADLRQRFRDHNSGKVRATAPHLPFTLVYYEAYRSKTDALRREIELKTKGQQKEFLKARIVNSRASSQPAADQP